MTIRAMCLVLLGYAAFGPEALHAQQAGSGPVTRWYDDAMVSRGAELFLQHCARCHGARAEGMPNWRKRGVDGKMPAPPLNGTGHGWHHPAAVLMHVIQEGSPGGQGNMPAWKGTLTPEDTASVIAWFQSKWPDGVYGAWFEIERRSRQ